MGWKALKDHFKINFMVQADANGEISIGSGFISDAIILGRDGSIKACSARTLGLDKLSALAKSLEADVALVRSLLERADVFSASIPVYTFGDGRIIEKFCEKLGWPNVTHDGQLMYENTHFASRDEAVKKAISEARSGIKIYSDMVAQAEAEVDRLEGKLAEQQAELQMLLTAEGTDAAGADGADAAPATRTQKAQALAAAANDALLFLAAIANETGIEPESSRLTLTRKDGVERVLSLRECSTQLTTAIAAVKA